MGCSKQDFIGDEVAGNDKASGMTTRVTIQWGGAKRVRSERAEQPRGQACQMGCSGG